MDIVLLAVLATYRISHMVVLEEGPLGIFVMMRSHLDPHQRTWIGRGLNCLFCVSFWVSVVVTALIQGSWLHWLAISGAVIIIHRVIAR